jgi:PPOX class probable F420-dependent enzyme
MTTLADVTGLASAEHGLTVVSTLRPDGTLHSSVVNAGVLEHPLGDGQVLGFVTYGKVKLANLRARPQIVAAFRSGWRWAAVEGRAELIGPNDAHPKVDAERLRLMLREVFVAAGGSHDNWDEYDRVMAEQGRTAVLISPSRIYGN